MKGLFVIFILSLYSTIVEAELVALDRSNFEAFIPREKFGLVLFYAPWEEDCKNVLEIFEKVAARFEEYDSIIIGKADIYEDKKLSTRYRIDSYCSIKYFVKGSKAAESYKGFRSYNDLVSLVNTKSVIELRPEVFKQAFIEMNDENYERIINDESKFIMAYYETVWCVKCKTMVEVIRRVAETFQNEENCVVVRVDGDKAVNTIFYSKVSSYPALRSFSKANRYGEQIIPGKFDENWSEKNLTKFLNIHCDTKRLPQGSLDKTVGRHYELDRLAGYFMRNSDRREHAIKETVAEIQKLAPFKRKKAHYYVKVMESVLSEGMSYVIEEHRRINKLLFGDMGLDQRDELTQKMNILEHFSKHNRDEL